MNPSNAVRSIEWLIWSYKSNRRIWIKQMNKQAAESHLAPNKWLSEPIQLKEANEQNWMTPYKWSSESVRSN